MVFLKLKVDVQGRKSGDLIKVDSALAKKLTDSDMATLAGKHIESPPKDKMIRKLKTK